MQVGPRNRRVFFQIKKFANSLIMNHCVVGFSGPEFFWT